MGKSKKKEKYVPLTGLTGIGEDYNIYIMAPREKIIGYLIGFVAGFLAAQIMFGVVIASIVIGAAVGFYAIPVYRRYLQERRRKAILLQFRDMLDSLSNSFSAGKNTPDAFTDAYSDLKLAYGEQAPIVKEMAIIVSGLHNNFVIEDLLRDMSARCGIDDINSFAETFAVCNRLGGNLKKVVVDSRDIISDKIEIEMEIQTTVAANKNEINIMCVMPFVIIAMMGTMGQASITANTPLNVLVKLIAIFMFVIAYKLGRKITDIKVYRGGEMSFVVAYALAGAGTLLVVLWVMLYLRYSSQYDVMIAAIDKKQFFLPEIFFIGFGFMDMFKVNLKTEAGRKKEKKIAEIYGEKYAEYYHNCIVGGQITYALTVAPLGLFIGAMTNDMTFAILVVAAAAALIVYLDMEVSSAWRGSTTRYSPTIRRSSPS